MCTNKRNLFYLGQYSLDKFNPENRYYSLAGMQKMKGISDELCKESFNVEIISSCISHGNHFCRAHKEQITDQISFVMFSSLGRKNAFLHFADIMWFKFQLFYYFIKNIHKTDTVIVYHSLFYVETILLLKKLIGFNLILEFEELFADVIGKKYVAPIELCLLRNADKYIFPTKLIPMKYDISPEKYVIIHGTYHSEKRYDIHKGKNYIDVVYAGNLDPRKGCFDAIEATKYLSSKYRLHILGTGTQQEINVVKRQIEENKSCGAEVIFEGVLKGEAYSMFLQKCDIGLCTQDPKAAFTDTSFPSKILSYLSNGLRVLAIDIPAIRESDVASILYFYQEQTAQGIARGIESICINDEYDSRVLLDKLFDKSKKELSDLILK